LKDKEQLKSTDQELNLKFDQKLAVWIIALICFGYPFQAFFPVFFSFDSKTWNLSIRLIYAIVLLVLSLSSEKSISKLILPVLIFWFLYSIRLICDLNIRGISFGGGDTLFVYSFAFGSTFLSIIASIFCFKKIPLIYIIEVFYRVILISGVSILFLVIYQNNGIDQSLFTKRLSITAKDEDLLTINTLWIGFFGCCLGVASLFRIAFMELKPHNLILTILLFFIAVIELFLGAARSPFIAFILLSSIILLTNMFKVFKRKGQNAARLLILVSFLIIAVYSVIKLSDQIDFAIIDRLINFNESRQLGDKEERDFEWQSAWNQFLDSPIIGDQFVTKYDQYYPHNVHLEVLMSLGLIGGLLYLMIYSIIVKNIVKAFRYFNKDQMFTTYIFLCSLFFTSTSGSLWTDATTWSLIVIISIKFYSKPTSKCVA
jgi:O-antigen ligase